MIWTRTLPRPQRISLCCHQGDAKETVQIWGLLTLDGRPHFIREHGMIQISMSLFLDQEGKKIGWFAIVVLRRVADAVCSGDCRFAGGSG